jgi:hypothetical protein
MLLYIIYMSFDFDLDINHYSREELIEMFQLPPFFDKDKHQDILEIIEIKMKDNININKQINKDIKIKTIDFITKAKKINFQKLYGKKQIF